MPKEPEEILSLLSSKDVESVALGLEMAQAHQWQIDPVATTLEELFSILQQTNSEIFDYWVRGIDDTFENDKSLRLITLGQKKFPLETVLPATPSLLPFLPWRGEVKTQYRIVCLDLGEHGFDAFLMVAPERNLHSLRLVYEALAKKIGEENLKEAWGQISELEDLEEMAGEEILLLTRYEELLASTPSTKPKTFTVEMTAQTGEMSAQTGVASLSVVDDEANAWFWETPGMLEAAAILVPYSVGRSPEISYQKTWEEDDLKKAWKLGAVQMKSRPYFLDSEHLGNDDICNQLEETQNFFTRHRQDGYMPIMVDTQEFEGNHSNTEVMVVLGKIDSRQISLPSSGHSAKPKPRADPNKRRSNDSPSSSTIVFECSSEYPSSLRSGTSAGAGKESGSSVAGTPSGPSRATGMTIELAFLIDGKADRRFLSIVDEAVGALSLLMNRHFSLVAREELRPNRWMYQWSEAGTEERITLYEFPDVPLTWLELQVSDTSSGEKIRAGLDRALSLDSLYLTNPEILLARARENPEDPVRVRNLGIGGNPENPEVLALLESALHSPQREVRSAVGDAAALRGIRALAPALREAAAHESDKNLSAALTFAVDQLADDSSPRNPGVEASSLIRSSYK